MDPARNRRSGPRSALSGLARLHFWLRTLRRWLRPPRRLSPTRAGWAFFAITFGVGFAALNTGNNLLYLVLALMLSFLVLSGVLSESALRGIAVRRRLPHEVFAEAPAPVALEIHNLQRRVPAFAVWVEDRARTPAGPRSVGRVFALRIAPQAHELRSYGLRSDRRGPLELLGFRVFTRFPFGLFVKSLEIRDAIEVLVYPAVEAVVAPPSIGAAHRGGESRTGPGAAVGDVAGLRPFAPGDPARRIHWRASLRSGELVVRDVETEHAAEVEVRLRTGDAEPGSPFERLVAWAASEVVCWLDAGGRVSLRTDRYRVEADSGSRHRARLLSFLARVEPDVPDVPEAELP